MPSFLSFPNTFAMSNPAVLSYGGKEMILTGVSPFSLVHAEADVPKINFSPVKIAATATGNWNKKGLAKLLKIIKGNKP
jgi:hypothetical protein